MNTREIKIRCWDGSKMVYPEYFVSFSNEEKSPLINDGILRAASVDWDNLEADDYLDGGLYTNPLWVLMQYTGLKDKNGVEIYEGDVIRVGYMPYTSEDDDGNDIDAYEETWDTKVSWSSDGGYVLYAAPGHDIFGEYSSTLMGWATDDGEYEYEVIGNIYENKELLK